jgi:hypothetical protein
MHVPKKLISLESQYIVIVLIFRNCLPINDPFHFIECEALATSKLSAVNFLHSSKYDMMFIYIYALIFQHDDGWDLHDRENLKLNLSLQKQNNYHGIGNYTLVLET